MTRLTEAKKFNNYKVLVQIAMRLHNPQVMEAYRSNGAAEREGLDIVLAKYLKIYPKDSILDVLMKCILFYAVDGRLWVQSTSPSQWSQRSKSFKPQLVIQYRPVGKRKKFGYNSYAGNPQFCIPHYDGTGSPYLPAFTLGKFTAKYMLNDQSYLMINAVSQEEAIAVCAQMASYTDERLRPTGTILENISISTRPKQPRMQGVKIEPFKGEYLRDGDYADKALVRLQF